MPQPWKLGSNDLKRGIAVTLIVYEVTACKTRQFNTSRE